MNMNNFIALDFHQRETVSNFVDFIKTLIWESLKEHSTVIAFMTQIS